MGSVVQIHVSGCNCERRYSYSHSNDSYSHSESATCNSSHYSNCRRPAAAYGTHPNPSARFTIFCADVLRVWFTRLPHGAGRNRERRDS